MNSTLERSSLFSDDIDGLLATLVPGGVISPSVRKIPWLQLELGVILLPIDPTGS